MGTFSVSISFTVKADDYDEANEIADQIADLVTKEDLADESMLIDVEDLGDEGEIQLDND